MADKTYSISKAIRDVLSRGVPSGVEAEYHFAEARSRESGSPLAFLGSMVMDSRYSGATLPATALGNGRKRRRR